MMKTSMVSTTLFTVLVNTFISVLAGIRSSQTHTTTSFGPLATAGVALLVTSYLFHGIRKGRLSTWRHCVIWQTLSSIVWLGWAVPTTVITATNRAGISFSFDTCVTTDCALYSTLVAIGALCWVMR